MGSGATTPCHEAVRAAAKNLVSRGSNNEFTVPEIIAEVRRAGHRFADSTVRTHVNSRCCVNAPDHHGVTYDYFERIEPDRYRLTDAHLPPRRYE
jgi:hypothetical protein